MSAQTPGSGAAEEQQPKKPKVQPANWHPTGVGEIGDGPAPTTPTPVTAPEQDGKPDDRPANWHPTGKPDSL